MNIKRCVTSSTFYKALAIIAVFALGIFFEQAYAGSASTSGIAISSITKHVGQTVAQLSKILTDIALVAGVGFILASFFKFHQHKLNPTQVPISQGVTLLLIGACLTLFVVMLPTAKRAVFGSAQISHIGGKGLDEIIGKASGS